MRSKHALSIDMHTIKLMNVGEVIFLKERKNEKIFKNLYKSFNSGSINKSKVWKKNPEKPTKDLLQEKLQNPKTKRNSHIQWETDQLCIR